MKKTLKILAQKVPLIGSLNQDINARYQKRSLIYRNIGITGTLKAALLVRDHTHILLSLRQVY